MSFFGKWQNIAMIFLLGYKEWWWRYIKKHWLFSKAQLWLFYSLSLLCCLEKGWLFIAPLTPYSANGSCLREAVKCDDLWRTPNHNLYPITQNDIICFHEQQGVSSTSEAGHSWPEWRKERKKNILYPPLLLNLKWMGHAERLIPFINPPVHRWRKCCHSQVGP